jgi:hypothetical protein
MQSNESGAMPPRPVRPFFDLQYRFAAAVATVSGVPIADALLRYTSLYLRFGLPRPITATDPGWREYLDGLRYAADPLAWTWLFAQTHFRPPSGEWVGCFAYHLPEPGTVQLHFENRDPSGISPLNHMRLPLRAAELRALFQMIARRHPEAERVRGGSWLYNLPAYASLFPPEYLRTARPVARFQAADMWGQFLDRHGQVRQAMAATFLACIEGQRSLDGLAGCFPYPVLALECDIARFYAFFGI